METDMATFQDLKSRADRIWHEQISGKRPWIRIGTATCGHAAGAFQVKEAIQVELQNMQIDARIDEVGCLGICFAEPLVDIAKPGGPRLFFGNVTPDAVGPILDDYLRNGRVPDSGALGYLGEPAVDGVQDLKTLPGIRLQQRIALRNAGHIAHDDLFQYIANGGYQGLNKALYEMQPENVIKEITDSGLRGRGGAAFGGGWACGNSSSTDGAV